MYVMVDWHQSDLSLVISYDVTRIARISVMKYIKIPPQLSKLLMEYMHVRLLERMNLCSGIDRDCLT